MHEVVTRPRQAEESAPAKLPRENPAQANQANQVNQAEESAASMARTGMLLGVVGLFILNLVLGPIAIGLGVVALRRGARPGAERAAALSSILLGAADVIVLLVLMALSLRHGGLVWHFGS
jgi:hypothetical protein